MFRQTLILLTKVDPPVVVEKSIPSTVDNTLKSIAEEEHGPLYALLTALSNSTPPIIDDKPVETTVKKHKEKKDKKEKHSSSKDGKPRKDKSKSKSQKSTPLLPSLIQLFPIIASKLESTSSGTGDIFGDLLGEEILKMGNSQSYSVNGAGKFFGGILDFLFSWRSVIWRFDLF